MRLPGLRRRKIFTEGAVMNCELGLRSRFFNLLGLLAAKPQFFTSSRALKMDVTLRGSASLFVSC